MAFLIEFVESKQAISTPRRVMINSGHVTSMGDALDVLSRGKSFIEDVVSGREPVKRTTVVNGIKLLSYARRDGRFSLRCPEELVLRARERPKLDKRICMPHFFFNLKVNCLMLLQDYRRCPFSHRIDGFACSRTLKQYHYCLRISSFFLPC